MLSTNNNSLSYKVFDCQTNKVQEFISLLREPEIQSFLKTFIEATLATSDLKILKRLSKVEETLGLLDEDLADEGTMTSSLPYRLKTIEDKVNSLTVENKSFLEPPVKPTTKTQKRACALVSKLRQCKKRFLTSSEIITFLKCEISEDLRITEDICNPREIKKEVLEKAETLFSDVILDKKLHGRKEVRLVLS